MKLENVVDLPVGTVGPRGQLHTRSQPAWNGHWNTQPGSPHSATQRQLHFCNCVNSNMDSVSVTMCINSTWPTLWRIHKETRVISETKVLNKNSLLTIKRLCIVLYFNVLYCNVLYCIVSYQKHTPFYPPKHTFTLVLFTKTVQMFF